MFPRDTSGPALAAGESAHPVDEVTTPARNPNRWRDSERIRETTQVFDKGGEPDRIRTCDPLIKSQLLYRLSYGVINGADYRN